MRTKLKRVLAGAVAITAPVTAIPLLAASPAAAATNNGTANLNVTSGSSDTAFTLNLGSGAACPGDSSGAGYRWQTFMIPAAADIDSTLTFGANGPTAVAGEFRQPLWTTTGSPVVQQLTDVATSPGGPGTISGIPFMNHAVYGPGVVPAGEYSIGVACTLGPADADQLVSYWTKKITVTTDAATGGTSQFSWAQGATPGTPAIGAVAPGDGTLTVSFTAPAADPAVTTYTLTATPQGGGAPVVQTGSASPITVTGLANGTTYDLALTATNSVGTSGAATGTGTPAPDARPAVTNFTATPGTGQVALSWNAPTGPAPTSYDLTITPAAGSPTTVTLPAGTTTYDATGLTAGTVYSFVVTPLHPTPYVGSASPVVQATPFASQVLQQNLTVTRPVGALVLTQVCGRYGELPSETAQLGFPSGLPAASAVAGGTAPTLTPGGVDADPSFPEYPYPVDEATQVPDPTYPTNCGVNLGNARFVTSGAGAGQFFAADGRLNQVTVVDTRDGDLGWNVVGQVGNFTATGGKSFSGSQLGWTPVKTSDSPAFTDSEGASYDQVATAGGVIDPNTAIASGLSSNRTLLSADAFSAGTGGLGIAQADARLKLLIPVTEQSGTYTATLTISAL